LEGHAPYTLPDLISRKLLDYLLSLEPGDEHFIGELLSDVPYEEKLRLRNVCKDDFDSSYWLPYSRHVMSWASVLNRGNQWNLLEFPAIYRANIRSWWVDDVIVTSPGLRFATSPRGVFTFPEFEWIYGQNITTHIDSARRSESDRLQDVIKHISSELIKRELRIVDAAAQEVRIETVTGLKSLPLERWVLPEGWTLVES